MTNPKLRFKATDGILFEDWKSVKVGDIAETCGGGTPATGNASYWGGAIQWLTPTEINTKYVHSSERTITQDGLKNSSAKLLPKGAIVLTTRATLGACSINNFEGDVCTNQGFQSLIGKSSVDSEFLYYLVASQRFQRELKKKASGSTFLEVSPSNLKKIIVAIPSKQEQCRVADFFSTLDEKIALAERKLTALQTLKSGLMQKIFSREIRFRWEDGNCFPDWIDVTIGDVAETCGGGTPSTGNEDFWGGDIQWLTPTEINSKYVHASKRTITDAGLKNSSAKLLPKEALVLTTRATVGACSINQFEGRVCTNQGFQSLICNVKVIPEFLYYVICSEKFQKAMLTNASGSTFLELSPKNLKKLPIEIPCQQEQRKIVAVLSELDKKIVVAKKLIDLLKLQKQAFMQQMFV